MQIQKQQTIKQWSKDDRPREKLIKLGAKALSNAELLAILIRTGTSNQTALDLARKLLSLANDSLNKLATFDLQKYKTISGLGLTKAVTIIAALELSNRRNAEEFLQNPIFTSSKEVFNFLKSILGDIKTEEAWYLTLNRANKLIGYYKLSSGGHSSTVIDTRIILKQALYDDASAIILAHNHPSGNIEPSTEDIQITEKLKNAAKQLDINLLDHFIVSQHNYFSFAENNLL
jgi:DNA repair protein RadC